MSGPVTIGDLKREGKLLQIGCLYVDPAIARPSAGADGCGTTPLLGLRGE